jgi:hypothetical protein
MWFTIARVSFVGRQAKQSGEAVGCEHCKRLYTHSHGFGESKTIQCKQCFDSIAEDKGPCADCRHEEQDEVTECTTRARENLVTQSGAITVREDLSKESRLDVRTATCRI